MNKWLVSGRKMLKQCKSKITLKEGEAVGRKQSDPGGALCLSFPTHTQGNEPQPPQDTARLHFSSVKCSEIPTSSTALAWEQNSSTDIQELNILIHLKGYGLQNMLVFELNKIELNLVIGLCSVFSQL